MLTSLLYFLFFETIQPSYSTFTSILPIDIVVEASVPTLTNEKTPIKKGESLGPVINAQAVYAIDLNSGMPLFTRDVFTHRPIASITKLVTAMVILDNHKLDEKVKISRNASQQEGSRMWLASGEEITIEALLTGLLVHSGNDAAVALAEEDAENEAAFLVKMNKKASQLGLKDTHFTDVKGFDKSANYSTAFDTIIFSRAALGYPFIKKTAALKTAEVTSTNGRIKHKLESTNELLENPYFRVVGLKTGKTPLAGESFVSLMIAPNGHEILAVVLDSPDRFKETKILLDWILRNFEFP